MHGPTDFFNDLISNRDTLEVADLTWGPEPIVQAMAAYDHVPGTKINFRFSVRMDDNSDVDIDLPKAQEAAKEFAVKHVSAPGLYHLTYKFRAIDPVEHDPTIRRYLRHEKLASIIRSIESDPETARVGYNEIHNGNKLNFFGPPPEHFKWGADWDWESSPTGFPYTGKIVRMDPQISRAGFPTSFSLEQAAIDGLDIVFQANRAAFRPYLGRALSYLWIRDFIEQQSEFMLALDILRQLGSTVDSLVRAHERVAPDGTRDTRKVEREAERLIKREALLNDDQKHQSKHFASLVVKIVEHVRTDSIPSATRERNNGRSFEGLIAERFRGLGYAVQATQATGDFGADLILEKEELRYVVQCKDLSVPSGVKAVQEVAAAKRRYACDFAVVVSRLGHTSVVCPLKSGPP